MTKFVETIDDVENFLGRPGKYHTSSGHQAFAVLQSLAWHPKVRLGEELFFPEGSVLFAEVRHGLKPNVEKIGWGTTDDYYERRLRDYDNWELAFWREILQNSRDAGATRVDFECVEDLYVDPETQESVPCVRCTATDNGAGMTYDTLMTAFFRRGGTQKATGSVGGFGDAKNLILTPWLGYEVRTQDVVVRGRHEELFASLTRQNEPFLKGTRLTVWMPVVKATTPEHAQFIVEQSSLTAIRFTVNGQVVHESLPQGKLVLDNPIMVGSQETGRLLAYHSSEAKRTGVYVRSHGIYMFEIQGYSDGAFKGVVTIEVNAPPVDVFTTKRDALSYNSSARADVYALLKELATDPRQALRQKRDKKEIVFKGTGALEVREGRVAELAAEVAAKVDLSAATRRRKRGEMLRLDKEEIDSLIVELDTHLRSGEEDDPFGLAPLASAFNILVANNEFIDTEQVTIAVQMAMWQPDFFLFQNISPWTMPKALHPESMGKKYHEVLRVWTEICRFILVQFGINRPFGVGWIFDAEYDVRNGRESVIAAAYKKHEGIDWLLLNPVKINVSGWEPNFEFSTVGDVFNLSDERSVQELVALAVHEITHMQGFLSHTDSYASALTDNMKVIFRVAPVLKKIVAEARKAVKETRAGAKERRQGRRTSRPKKTLDWDDRQENGVWSGYSRRDDQRFAAEIIEINSNYHAAVRHPDGNIWISLPLDYPTLKAAQAAAECAVSATSNETVAKVEWEVPGGRPSEEVTAGEKYSPSDYLYGMVGPHTAVSVVRDGTSYCGRWWVPERGEWTRSASYYRDIVDAMHDAEVSYLINRDCGPQQ
jgi:hypothetical protein